MYGERNGQAAHLIYLPPDARTEHFSMAARSRARQSLRGLTANYLLFHLTASSRAHFTRRENCGLTASTLDATCTIVPVPASPQSFVPMQPMLAKRFHRSGWIYEEKYDGWRMLAYKDGPRVRLISRQNVGSYPPHQAPITIASFRAFNAPLSANLTGHHGSHASPPITH